jgi:hypothetical protein
MQTTVDACHHVLFLYLPGRLYSLPGAGQGAPGPEDGNNRNEDNKYFHEIIEYNQVWPVSRHIRQAGQKLTGIGTIRTGTQADIYLLWKLT